MRDAAKMTPTRAGGTSAREASPPREDAARDAPLDEVATTVYARESDRLTMDARVVRA